MNSTGAQVTFVSETQTSRYNSSKLNSHFNSVDSFVVPSNGPVGQVGSGCFGLKKFASLLSSPTTT
jgi:hypothetical protein